MKSPGVSAPRVLAAVLLFAGPILSCGVPNPDGPMAQIKMKHYELTYYGEQKRTTIGDDSFTVVRVAGGDIRVYDGLLTVGSAEYGPVEHGDKITVMGRQVAVNGRAREPIKP